MRLEQTGGQLCERARQAGRVDGFDETLSGSDLPCRARPEESTQLVMHRCATVLRHGLEASERDELALGLEHTLDGVDAQRPDQLVLEVGDACEETERIKGLMGSDRDGRLGERAADVPLVSDVVQAAEPCTLVSAHELRKQPREVRYTISRQDLDVMQVEIATEEAGKGADSSGIAVPLDEDQGSDRCRGSHASVEMCVPNARTNLRTEAGVRLARGRVGPG